MADDGFAHGFGLFKGRVGGGAELGAAGCGEGVGVRLQKGEGVDAGEEFVGQARTGENIGGCADVWRAVRWVGWLVAVSCLKDEDVFAERGYDAMLVGVAGGFRWLTVQHSG